jgi:hypothetical protein
MLLVKSNGFKHNYLIPYNNKDFHYLFKIYLLQCI